MIDLKLRKDAASQRRIIEAFESAGVDVDVSISNLYYAVHGRKGEDRGLDSSLMQMRIGAIISRLNKHLAVNGMAARLRIVPGRVKRTYRLIDESKAGG